MFEYNDILGANALLFLQVLSGQRILYSDALRAVRPLVYGICLSSGFLLLFFPRYFNVYCGVIVTPPRLLTHLLASYNCTVISPLFHYMSDYVVLEPEILYCLQY